MEKFYISANKLLEDSFRLGVDIYEGGLRPDLIIGIWRGGTPVAIAVHEFFSFMGHLTDHFPVRALSYTGIAARTDAVEIDGLEYVTANCEKYEKVLIIDDVFDTGNSFMTIIKLISAIKPQLEISIAAPWYKAKNNQTDLVPDFYVHETDQWLVFPHELKGLTWDEIKRHKPEIHDVIQKLL